MSNVWGILSKFTSSSSGTVELKNLFFNMEFDVITSEQHKWGAEVTSNPVEDGSNVADHIKVNPDSLDITGIISNASLSRWKGNLIEKILGILDRESNVQRAFDQLRKLLDNRQPVTVYTRYRTYPDMVLTSLSIPRSSDSGDAIEFSASFINIKRVKTITVDAEDAGINPGMAESPPTKRKAVNTKALGSQYPAKSSADVNQQVESYKTIYNEENEITTNMTIKGKVNKK